MRLIGRQKLDRLKSSGADTERWARAWVAEVAEAHWRQPADVTEQFPNATHKGAGRFSFPISHCAVEVQLWIAFAQGIALISDLTNKEVTHGS